MHLTWSGIIADEYRRHPNMTVRDLHKLVYQACFGGDHLLRNPDGFLEGFAREWDCLPMDAPREDALQLIHPSGRVARLHLGACKAMGLARHDLARLLLSQPFRSGRRDAYQWAWATVLLGARSNEIPFTYDQLMRVQPSDEVTHHSPDYGRLSNPQQPRSRPHSGAAMPSRNPSVVIPNDRWIGHLDMDAFFAAVEQLDCPEYRGRPVIVGGLGLRGVVSTASYEARPYGVRSALPMATARRLCPDGIYVTPRFLRYREISEHVRNILRRFSPTIETISLDEAFFDLTEHGPRFEDVHRIAKTIKRDVQAETKLTCSVGLAPNRFLAKLGSELNKPNGFMVIDPDQIHEILDPLPVGQIWGVGEVTAKRLAGLGFLRVKDLRLAPTDLLVRELGSTGRRLQQLAMGIDDTPLSGETDSKSISRETTYSFDVTDFGEMEAEVRRLSEQVALSLHAESLVCRVVRVKVRYPNFRTITRQSQLSIGTDSPRVIETLALELLRKRVPLDEGGIRLLGVGLGGIVESFARQLPLFPDWL